MANYYFSIRQSDNFVIGCQTSGEDTSPPSADNGFFMVETTKEIYNQFASNIADEKAYEQQQAVWVDSTFQFIDRPEIPSTIDKTSIVANGTDLLMITGLPEGTHVKIYPAAEWVVNDGAFEFTSTIIGNFDFTLTHPEYKARSFTVHAS